MIQVFQRRVESATEDTMGIEKIPTSYKIIVMIKKS